MQQSLPVCPYRQSLALAPKPPEGDPRPVRGGARYHRVRGYDLSIMTLIAGKSGWIVIHPAAPETTLTCFVALDRAMFENAPPAKD